jgi:hypothetical protein
MTAGDVPAPDGATRSSARSLEAALGRIGIGGRIEARERLAVLVPGAGVALLADAALRRQASALAREHGFTHLALELLDEPADGRGGGAALHRD